jgi:hypothetical protein
MVTEGVKMEGSNNHDTSTSHMNSTLPSNQRKTWQDRKPTKLEYDEQWLLLISWNDTMLIKMDKK